MATCLNIYTKAPPNRIVIGRNLYDMINDSFERDYHFIKIYEYPPDKEAKTYISQIFESVVSIFDVMKWITQRITV